jgi:hypothetical protein
MITGEDYNIAPLTAGTDILKVKSVNRASSGLSKYFDLSDVTGRYSKTNIFASDGILYQEEEDSSFEFEFKSRNQVLAVIKNRLNPIIALPELRSFYLEKYSRFDLTSLSITWTEVNITPGESRGYFSNSSGVLAVGAYSLSNLRYVAPGSMVKFLPPTGKYFDQKNALKTIPALGIPTNGRPYIWATVKQVIGDGSNGGVGTLSDGTGPVIFSTRVPSGCKPAETIYKFNNLLSYSIETEIANICTTYRNFGLTIDATTREWNIILNSNLDTVSPFSLSNQNNVEDLGVDASWLVSFVWTGKSYKVTYRTLNYIFESDKETSFFIDASSVNYDFTTNSVIKDKIDILSINAKAATSTTGLGYDHTWQIDGPVVEPDGYVEPKKVKVSFYDYNNTGQLLDPNSFDEVAEDEYVYFKKLSDGLRYSLTTDDIIPLRVESDVTNDLKINNQLFYFSDPSKDVVKYWSTGSASLVYTDQYFGRKGRSNIKFHYQHNSGNERRIDPSKSNLIDIYVLTTAYDNDVRSWVAGNLTTEPLAPTSQSLEQNYIEALTPIKAISDEIIFHPVKYKVLFGSSADVNLQAKFKAVKNSDRPTTDNDLKTRILTAINEFFALENWEFGQSFYFSELSTYVMNALTPDITNFVIIPVSNNGFGSMYEVACQSSEIFISGATIADIEIIDAITASQLKSTSSIVTTSGT